MRGGLCSWKRPGVERGTRGKEQWVSLVRALPPGLLDGLGREDQFAQGQVEGGSNPNEGADVRASLPSLDPAEIGSVQPGLVTKLLLGPSPALSFAA